MSYLSQTAKLLKYAQNMGESFRLDADFRAALFHFIDLR